MATNLGLDDKVVEQAVALGQHKSKREAVMAALLEYIRRHQQMRIFELEGKIDFDPSYDHRAARKKKRQ